jgi:4-amino-4-deoxy-L-arabinose transferase-like glycosyltransferase
MLPDPQTETPRSRWPAWLPLLLILLGMTLIALPVLTYPLGRDQGEFATIGRGILNGRIPYVDLWNPKPPAVFYIYALAIRLFGQTAEALRVIDLLMVPPIAAMLYWLGKRLASRAVGLWAALLFPVFYFTESFWTLTQNDGIVLLPMVAAMACAFKAADGGRRALLWALAAGALCAWVLWFKYPFMMFVAVVGVVCLWRPSPPTPLPQGEGGQTISGIWRHWKSDTTGRDVRTSKTEHVQSAGYNAPFSPRSEGEGAGVRAANVLAFVVGGLIVGVGGILHMASIGALEALIQSAIVTSNYTALGFNVQDLVSALGVYIPYRWAQWGILFVLALLWLPLRWLLRDRECGRWAIVWLWLLAAVGIMLMQAKAYDYHWLPMLPPLVLLGADTLERALGRLARRFGGGAPLRAAAGVVLAGILVLSIWPRSLPYLTGQQDVVTYYSRFQAGEFIASESLVVADYLRERVAPGDSLFIWGFRPEVYYLSDLNPAIRFIFQFPLVGTWYPPEWKQEAVDILWAALPPYVLVLQVDYMPWVTGREEDSNQLLQEYTELNNWLMANYSPETQIGNFLLWRRNS